MKTNSELLRRFTSIDKIVYYKTLCIVNGKYLYVDFSNNKIDIFEDVYNISLREVYYDDDHYVNFFNDIIKQMDETFNYYLGLQDKIEEMYYPEKSYYIMIINISKIYHLLDIGRYFIDDCANSDAKITREIFDLIDHDGFIDIDELNYKDFISVLVSLYRDNYLFDKDKYKLTTYEEKLFYGLISCIPKIRGDDIDEVIKLINYVDDTYNYLLKKYKYYQKDEEGEFE